MSSVFRKEQRYLSPKEREQVNEIKQLAQDLHDIIDMLPPSLARDIAQTRLQECVMWSVRTISDSL
jgi:hypothetical protein